MRGKSASEYISFFLLAKEFGWLPSQIKKEEFKDMRAIELVLSTFNRVKNQEIERSSKKNRR